jgi:hypothetical protein
MNKARAKFKKALDDTKDTLSLVRKLIDLIYEEPDRKEIDRYLQEFKKSFKHYHCYPKMIKDILSQVELRGMDVDHIKDMLSFKIDLL